MVGADDEVALGLRRSLRMSTKLSSGPNELRRDHCDLPTDQNRVPLDG